MGEKTYATGWWVWVLAMLIPTFIVLGILNAAGLFGRTIVERKVFEHSYQKQAGLQERIAVFESQIAEINTQLSGQPDANTKANLLGQRAAINVQLQSARSQLK